jgi:two-component system sensor histidine kinase AlgZ
MGVATALSVASIRQQFRAPVNVAISRFGIGFLRDFAAEVPAGGIADLGLRENGYLFLTGSAEGRAALEDLADLFRTSLAASGSFVTLEEELTLCRHYLHLESLRLGSRLRVDWRVDDLPKQALLPALTLQPLLENAIYHGIETCAEGGTLQVHGHLNKDLIKISLRNPQDGPSRPGHGLAIANTRQRLGLSFGPAGRLELHQTPTTFEVILVFPLLTGVPDGARPAAP